MSDVLLFTLMGLICFFYNKPIAQELGRINFFPIRWLFGEKKWVVAAQRYFVLFMRFTLYGGVLLSLAVIILWAMHLQKYYW